MEQLKEALYWVCWGCAIFYGVVTVFRIRLTVVTKDETEKSEWTPLYKNPECWGDLKKSRLSGEKMYDRCSSCAQAKGDYEEIDRYVYKCNYCGTIKDTQRWARKFPKINKQLSTNDIINI